MKDLLRQFIIYFDNYDEYKRRLDAYDRILKTEEWKFLRDTFMTIKAEILADMLSRKHTDLSETEKDVIQKTYYNINQMLDFLSEPKKWIAKRSRWESVVKNIGRRANQVRQKGDKNAGGANT